MPPSSEAAVFSCLACRSIVADTTDYVTAVEHPQQLVLVAGLTGTREDPAEQRVTGDGVDSGSTYRTIVCEQCGAALGRVYTQTQLGFLQGAFCLDVARLRSYELGSATQRRSAASVGYQHQRQQPDEKPNIDREREDLYQRIDELGTAYEALAADMLKVICATLDAALVHALHQHAPSDAHRMMLHVQVQHLLTLHDARLNRLDGFEHGDAGPDQTET